MIDIFSELSHQIAGDVRFDAMTKQLYSTDASMYQVEPIGVVFPRHDDDLQAVAELAWKHKVPILPRGGGTSLAGQTTNHALVLDTSTHLNRILEVNTEEGWAIVEPGVVQDQLNAHLAPLGYLFGPDTSTSNRATIGGMTGNNSCGARSILYGKTIDHILEIQASLADGTRLTFGELDDSGLAAKIRNNSSEGKIYRDMLQIAEANREEVEKRYPKILRRVSGYNLDELLKPEHPNFARMLVGSEGTLALTRLLKVRIMPQPKAKVLLVAQFDDMIQAVEADNLILAHNPSAMELIDHHIITQAKASPAFAGKTGFLVGDPGAIVIVEFYGENTKELEDRLDKLEADLKSNKMGYAHVRAVEGADQALVWNLRKAGLGLLMGVRTSAKPLPFVEDTVVDPAKLAPFLKEFDAIVRRHGTHAGYYGHASVGCLHIRPFIDLKIPSEREKLMGIFTEVADLVQHYGGTIAGEHGDGRARSWLIKQFYGEKIFQAFRDFKQAFDPHNLLNPGNIVDGQPPLENLRWGHPVVNPVETTLDFSRDGGFSFAIEMCNGNGQCRKVDTGTMCPSFQATRNDIHSTRGRANALRGVLHGQFNPDAFDSREMYEVMDLCLECKACKTECPSKVDMAKFKYEFLYHYNRKQGTPLRSRIFGHIHALSRLGSAVAPLANWMMETPLQKWLLSLIGLAPQRNFPRFSSHRFSQWFESEIIKGQGTTHAARVPGDKRPPVVLFHDTFMEFNTPSLGEAAVKVLEAAGYRVVLPRRQCCGRPAISKGLLEQGTEMARYNVNSLLPYVDLGIPIVGVEPSCILTLKEDYRDLIPGKDTEKVAAAVLTIDEFLAELTASGKLKFTDEGPRNFLLHGHCHQKALVGTTPTLSVLSSIPNATVSEVDSGCCGMAGSFGYEAEHYDISLSIGEQRLFPAIRNAPPDTILVAGGISCRQQIHHGTLQSARHLVEVVAEALHA